LTCPSFFLVVFFIVFHSFILLLHILSSHLSVICALYASFIHISL
jgi:hypothetical protein